MQKYDPAKPLFSIHIPKCAGSSFSSILQSWFGKGFKGHYPNEKRNRLPVKHRLGKSIFSRQFRPYTCVHGHFNNARGTGVFDYYPEAEQLITVLRDPFDLHVSTYFYVRKEFERSGVGAFRDGSPHPIIANNWSVDEYLDANPRSYMANFLPRELTLDNLEELFETQFIFIGITESLQASVDKLADILGFESLPVPEDNVSTWSESIPDGSRAEFERKNPLEMAAYRYAKDRLSALR